MEDDIMLYEDFEVPEIDLSSCASDPNIIRKTIINALSQEIAYSKKQEEYNGKVYKPSEILWVSDLIFCPVKKSYEMLAGEPKKEREEIIKERLSTSLGTLLHKELSKKIKAGGESEVRFSKDYKGKYLLVGTVDYLMPNAILEFKTTMMKSMPEAHQYYKDQVQLYMWLADKKIAYLVAIFLPLKDIMVYEIKRDEDRINFLLNRGLEIINALKTLNLDSVKYDNSYDFICRSCEYNECPAKKG